MFSRWYFEDIITAFKGVIIFQTSFVHVEHVISEPEHFNTQIFMLTLAIDHEK